MRGPSHELDERPCQDAWVGHAGAGIALLCVADGAGSAAHAEFGARAAVAAACSELERALGELEPGRLVPPASASANGRNDSGANDANPSAAGAKDAAAAHGHAGLDLELCKRHVTRACAAAREALVELARSQNNPLRDYACTLLVMLAHARGYAVAHIGDGGAVGALDGELRVLSAPERGEFANETSFLTAAHWQRTLRVAAASADVTAVALFTDGCQGAVLQQAETLVPFAKFFGPVFAYAAATHDTATVSRELETLLDAPRLRAHGDDDKTLAIATLAGAG